MASAEIAVTVQASGAAYVALVAGTAPASAVRTSVGLDALEEAGTIAALESLVLDFDHYGRLIGISVSGSADSVLAPSLLEAARTS
jgi:hypothetical protein